MLHVGPLLSLALALGGSARSGRPLMQAGSSVSFSKYHGLGNDFALIDCRAEGEPVLTPEQAAKMCDRNFGVGADGVIFVLPPDTDDSKVRMRIYNSDGSEPEMCGNGIRCMARFVADVEGNDDIGIISTLAGPIIPSMQPDGAVRVDMGEPILKGSEVPTTLPEDADGRVIDAKLTVGGQDWAVTCVSMGNPHAVVFVDDVDALDLYGIGPQFETDKVFPAKTNTEFVQVLSPSHLKMKVWERGAGPTLACGTGTCALVVAGVLNGKIPRPVVGSPCRVSLPGGDLLIEWDEATNKIFMTGPAQRVYSGSYSVA